MKKKPSLVPSSPTNRSAQKKPVRSSGNSQTAAVLQEIPSQYSAFDFYDLRAYVRDQAERVYVDGLRECYDEMIRQEISSTPPGTNAALSRICAGYGIDYRRDIHPIFGQRFNAASFLPILKKAQIKAKKQYTSWWRSCRARLRGITQEQLPLPPKWKNSLRVVSHSLPFPSSMENFMGTEPPERVNKLLGTTGLTALTFSSKTKPHRHPAWRDLQKDLFSFLTEKKG